MNVKNFSDEKEASHWVALHIAQSIQLKPNLVLGCAARKTPIGLYDELVRLHKKGTIDFSKIVAFVLDEFVELGPSHPSSFETFLRKHVFSRVNIPPSQVHIPSVQTTLYDRLIQMAGGIDIQILGLGKNGHIGFNEPGTSFDSVTHVQDLTLGTREGLVENFGSIQAVPQQAVTMGIGTILKSKQIYLLAFGEAKAKIVKLLLEGAQSQTVPCTALQKHPNLTIVLDKVAASLL